MASLQYVLEEGNREGWDSTEIVVIATAAGIALVTFFVHELETEHPVVDLRVFANRSYSAGTGINFLLGIALFSGSYLFSLYCGAVMRYTALDIGKIFLVAGLIQIVLMPLLGKFSGKADGRALVAFGIATACLSLWMNGHLTSQASFWDLARPQMVRAFAMGFIFIPLSVIALSDLPADKRGNATGLFNLTRELGGSIGTAWMSVALDNASKVYGSQIGESVNAYNPVAQDQLAALRGVAGNLPDAGGGALSILALRVQLQALIRAFNDGFLTVAALFAAGLVLVLFLKRPAPGREDRRRALRKDPHEHHRFPPLPRRRGALRARPRRSPAALPGPRRPAPAPEAVEARSAALDARIGALFTPGAGLTAEEVAARAAATSFDVQARRAELAAAAAAVDQAIVGYFPRLTVTARYLRLSPLDDQVLGNLLVVPPTTPTGPIAAGTPIVNATLALPSLSNNSILHANVTIPVSDYVLRIPEAHAAASRSARAAELGETAARRKAALDGRLAYYGWVRAKLQAFVTHQALGQARDHYADVRHAFDAGATSKADVLRVEAQVASSELLVQRAEGLVATSEESVKIAMHEPDPGRAYTLGEDVRAPLPPLGTPRDLRALYAEALDRRPEIRALDETAWSLKEQGRVARAAAYPRFDALGQLSYDNPEQRIFPPAQEFKAGWAVGAQVTWTLNDIGVGVTQGRQVDAHRAQVEAQKGQLLDGLRNEVSQAEQAVEDAEVAVETGARGLAAAEESYRVRRSLFQNGRAISVELSDAETELTRASLELVNARVELRVARARLLHAIGRDAVEPAARP